MTILKTLKFVQGAVQKRGGDNALAHFRINKGHVQGFNGSLALSAPIAFDIDCLPQADQFIKAISSCKDESIVSMSMTDSGRLAVRSGNFKAFINCLDNETALPYVEPEGATFAIDGENFLQGIKVLAPFVDNNNIGKWSNGILFNGNSLFATNNIVVAEYWIGESGFKPINIPYAAIKELIRVNQVPKLIQLAESSITFVFNDDIWIRAQLLNNEWPDVEKFLNQPAQQMEAVNPKLFEGIDAIKAFTDKSSRIYFHDGVISTSIKDGEGATFKIDEWKHTGVYQASTLLLLKDKISMIDFSMYPKNALFYGDNFRGMLVGMRE